MQQQILPPYGANIHKLSHFAGTIRQRVGTSKAEESAGVTFSQDQSLPLAIDSGETVGPTTTIKDAFNAVAEEARSFSFQRPTVLSSSAAAPATSPTIGVLDIYQDQADKPALHGDKVYSVLENGGFTGQDIQKIEHGTLAKSNQALCDLLFQEGPEPAGDRLNAYIELSASHMLTKTNGTLGAFLADPNFGLSTINQSQGNSRADVYSLLVSPSIRKEDGKEVISETGQRLAGAMGLNIESLTPQSLRQAYVDRVNSVIDGSGYIAEQQQEHVGLLQQLRQRGTLVVSSSGNSADELWDYRAQGLRVPDSFDDDLSKVGPKLIVGALDDHGTTDKGDDEIAFFTSLYPGVNVLANGVNVPTVGGPATGTSYAAPLVAVEAEKIRRQHPEWSVDQVEAETKSRFTATDGFNILR